MNEKPSDPLDPTNLARVSGEAIQVIDHLQARVRELEADNALHVRYYEQMRSAGHGNFRQAVQNGQAASAARSERDSLKQANVDLTAANNTLTQAYDALKTHAEAMHDELEGWLQYFRAESDGATHPPTERILAAYRAAFPKKEEDQG